MFLRSFLDTKGCLVLLAVVAVAAALLFAVKLYAARRFMYKLQRAGLPMPPYHPILGHFAVLARCEKRVAHDDSADRLFGELSRPFRAPAGGGGMHYVDLWPLAAPVLVVTSAAGAAQVQRLGLALPRDVCGALDAVTGGESLLTMATGARWAGWRRLLGPGLGSGGAGATLRLVPRLVREAAVFRALLLARARSGAVFQLEDLTLRLALDVIGSVAMGVRLRHQERDNPVASSLMTLISWNNYAASMNPLTKYISVGWLVQWYNGRVMDHYIHAQIDEQFAEAQNKNTNETAPCDSDTEGGKNANAKSRPDSILSLAIRAVLEDDRQVDGESRPAAARGLAGKTDSSTAYSEFRKVMTANIRLFLFAGHDATSTTLIYAFHHLAGRPEWLSLVRAEHDAVFGRRDPEADPCSSSSPSSPPYALRLQERLASEPALLNTLPRTLAVIKEVLRLHPPSSKMTAGRPGADLVDGAGRVLPTQGCYVWVLHNMVHTNPGDWDRPDDFLPERWLPGGGGCGGGGSSSQNGSGKDANGSGGSSSGGSNTGAAYRPFGQGPRSCIGQALAIMMLKVALVLTLRDVDITPAHEEWLQRRNSEGTRKKKRAERPTAEHPRDGYPCRVQARGC